MIKDNSVTALTNVPEFLSISSPTLGATAAGKLAALSEGLGLSQLKGRAVAVLRELAGDWFDWPLEQAPSWPSDITDDHTPFEFSVAFRGASPELRLLVEPQGLPIGPRSSWEAGLETHERLRHRPGVSLHRFERIRELFGPHPSVVSRFSMWHAAALPADRDTVFKVYLNPEILGLEAAPGLVQQALCELGLADAWGFLVQKLAARGVGGRFLYFSLDLTGERAARVKVYTAHEAATASEIDEQMRGSRGYTEGSAVRWLETVTGSLGPFTARPLITCFAFDGTDPRPSGTLHIPARCYADSDASTFVRLAPLLPTAEFEALRSGITAMAGRPLDVGRSLITYVSLQRSRNGVGLTTYLAPEAFAIAAPRQSSWLPRSAAMVSGVRGLSNDGEAAGPRSMANVQVEIERQRETLRTIPFLRWLEDDASLEQLRMMASHLSFYVLVFQDMLRLARVLTTDAELKEVARKHELEDKGHDAWFLHDLDHLGLECEVAELFSESHEGARDVSYAVVSDIIRASSDLTRLAIILSLEAIGDEFFRRAIQSLQRVDAGTGLKYFARSHQAVEQAHSIFDDQQLGQLIAILIPPEVRSEVLRGVERTFANLTVLASYLDSTVRETSLATRRTG